MSRHEGCGGTWIDISVLNGPRLEKCSLCRTTRAAVPDDLDDDEVEDMLREDEITSDVPPDPAIPTWAIVGLMITNLVLIALITYDVFLKA